MVCVSCFLFKLILGLGVVVGLLKLIAKFITRRSKSRVILYGKTAIVTGANTGIGYETALDFASRGARVILACRNPLLAEEARRKIVAATKNENVVVKLIDFASLDSVRAFAKAINSGESRLDILVNNAGALRLGNYKTKDGLQVVMQVNHFGPFLLTNLLINLLKKSAPSRIVHVSGGGCKHALLNVNNLNEPFGEGSLVTKILGVDACNSKLCNVLISNELAERLAGTGVVSNSLHPGLVKTEITRNTSAIFKTLFELFARTSEEGAQTQIYAAVDPEMENVTGEYLENVQIVDMPATVIPGQGPGLAKRVWEKSEELVKLKPEERQI